jgi:hypothetical protein
VKGLRRLRLWIRWRTWLLATILVISAGILDLRILRRQTLWVDELFSLAIATGHSVEHPSVKANPTLGDFVQADHPVPMSYYRAYVDHQFPRASVSAVIRATFLSDTNPPLYYLLLYGWTSIVGTTDGALRSFSVGWYLACIPVLLFIARRTGGIRCEWATGLLFVGSPIAVYYST